MSLLSTLAHCADVTARHSAGVFNTVAFRLAEELHVGGVHVSQPPCQLSALTFAARATPGVDVLVTPDIAVLAVCGNGQQALHELVNKYKKVTDEVIRSTMDQLVNTTMKQGEDPDGYFMEKTLARAEPEKMGGPISDQRFKDICVQGFTPEYRDIKMMIYRDPTFDIDQMQSTTRPLYLRRLACG